MVLWWPYNAGKTIPHRGVLWHFVYFSSLHSRSSHATALFPGSIISFSSTLVPKIWAHEDLFFLLVVVYQLSTDNSAVMAETIIQHVLNLPFELQRQVWRCIVPLVENEEVWGLGHLVEHNRGPIRTQLFYPSHPMAQSPIGHAYMQEFIRTNPVIINPNLSGMMRRNYPYATTQLQDWDREWSSLCKQLESWANFADKFESFQAMNPMTVVFKFPHWGAGALGTSSSYLPVVRSGLRNLISLALRLPPGKL